MLALALLAAGTPLRAQSGKENAEYKLAVGLYNDGMHELAADQLKNFIAAYPATAQGIEARFTLGLAQMKLARFEEARVTFQEFALTYTDHPKAAEAWLNVGAAYHALGNDREAATAYERVRVFHPKSDQAPEALLKAAALRRAGGDRSGARAALRDLLQDYGASPSAPAGRLSLAELYAADGEIDLALREARKVSESNAPAATRAAAFTTIGAIQNGVSLRSEAEAAFQAAAALTPASAATPRALLELGALESRGGRFASASKHLRQVADDKNAPDSLRAAAQLRLGEMHLAQHDATAAVAAYAKAATLGSGTSVAAQALTRGAQAAAAAGDFERSIAMARQAASLPLSRWTPRALAITARSAEALRRFDDAAQAYRSLLAATSASSDEVLFRLGTLHAERRGDHRSALAAFDELLRERPRSPRAADALLAIARSQLALGEADAALKTSLDAQRRYPGAPYASQVDSLVADARRRSADRRDEALRRLARLVGEMLLGHPTAELSYRLGTIYRDDLGDDAAAADAFAAALGAGLAGEHRADAMILRAKALASAHGDTARAAAIRAYDDYLGAFPDGARAEEALYERTLLAAAPLSGARRAEALAAFTARYPATMLAGKVLLERGRALAATDEAGALASIHAAAACGDAAVRAEALWLAADVHLRSHRSDSALVSWRRIIDAPSIGPRTVDALLAAAQQSRDAEAVLACANRLMKEFFYTDAARKAALLGADALVRTGDGAAAESIARALCDTDEEFPYGDDAIAAHRILLARALARKGDGRAAAAEYHRAIAASDDPALLSGAFYALGAIAKSQGEAARAASYFSQGAALGGTGNATPEIAELLFQSGQYSQAAAQFAALADKADTLERKRDHRRRQIVATFRLDDITTAQTLASAFRKNFDKAPEADAEFTYERGLAYFRKQDYVAARTAFQAVAEDHAETRFGPWGEYYLAKILELGGSLDEAAKAYADILEHRTGSDVVSRTHLALGNMHFNAERYEDAIRHYQAVTSRPEEAADILPYAMNNLIEAYESTKLYDDALRMARDFVARYPNDESALDKKIKIGTLYTKAGYYDQAIQHFQGILDEAGSLLEAEIRYDIGEAYYGKGDYAQAILEFLKVPYLVTKQGKVDWTATSFYMAGQSYEKMSRFDEAIGMYQQIVDRPGIDATFKSAARKEIDRVKQLTSKGRK